MYVILLSINVDFKPLCLECWIPIEFKDQNQGLLTMPTFIMQQTLSF